MAKKVTSPLTAGLFRKPAFWFLFTIVFLGGCFRFYNPDWDYQHSFHPDERNILGQTAGIQSENGYRVSFWAYGQLTIYLYRATGELLSTPSFFYNLFRGNEGVAQFAYWFLLFAVLAVGGAPFFKGKFRISLFGASSFVFANFAFWSLIPLYSNQGFSGINFIMWFLLLGFLYFLYGLFIEEKNETLETAVASLLFVGFLVYKFFPIFSIWIKAVEDGPAKIICFALVVVVSFGLSFIAAEFFEIDWEGIPFYSAVGSTALLGIVPFFLPVVLAQTFGVLAFTILVSTALLWWALASRWGRGCVSLLGFWVCLAALAHAGKQYTGYGECMIIGRLWAAAFSTATIAAIFILVYRIYQNISMAFLAAACFAFSVVSIEQTHYCISESFITFMFVVVAICSYEIIREGSWRSYLLAGGAFGLAMAAKTSCLYYLFVLVTAHLVALSQKSAKDWEKEGKKFGDNRTLFSVLAILLLVLTVAAFGGVGYKFRGVLQDLFEKAPVTANGIWIVLFVFLAGLGIMFASWGAVEFKVFRAQMSQWLKLVGAGGLAFLIFCLLSPWSLLDMQKFMESQNYEWHTVSIADACYVLQFKDTPRYLYQLKNLMSVELWWPLGVTVVLGMFWVLGRFVLGLVRPVNKGYLLLLPFTRNKGFAFSLPDLLILCWFIPYFGFIGSWNTKFVRYMVPLIPAFCIFGARFLTDIIEWGKKIPLGKFLRPVLCTIVIGPSLFYSIAYMHVYRFQHPWIESSVWIYKNIPFGSKIFNESWGDGLPVDISPEQDNRVDRIMSPGLYHSQDVTPYEMHGFPTDNSPVKKNYYANLIPQGDYISISSKKLWYTLTDASPEFRPNGFNIYPVTSRYYRCLWSGLLGYKMVAEFHNFPSFLGWEHPDDMAEESFSVYDHPRIYIFKKFETVTPDKILKLLETDDYVKGINRDQMRNITPANVDSFIAERHQYLESHGLLAALDEVTPAPVSATQPSPISKREELQPTPVPTVGAQPMTTPEIKLNVPPTVPKPPDAKTLQVLQSYAEHPVVENDPLHPSPAVGEEAGYQFWAWFSWVGVLILLGWLALPLTLRVLESMPGGAYSLSKVLGFFLFSWLVWFTTSIKICRFTLGSCWFWFLALIVLSLFGYWRDWRSIKALYSKWSKPWLIQEGAFVLAFLAFTLVKIFFPNVHDPGGEGYNGGGEAGMDFGFLASIVRGETFPPQNMWMAGLPISYSYYFGHLMMGILTKTLGLVPALTYNLALITLFSCIFSGSFGLAYALSGRLSSGWIAGFLCAVVGNLAGAKQYLDTLHQCFNSFFSGLNTGNFFSHLGGFFGPFTGQVYDFFGPSRVIPGSYNEFPYFSVLYGDMHPHTLAQPFGLLFIAIIASLYMSKATDPFSWNQKWALSSGGILLAGILAFCLHPWWALLLVFAGLCWLMNWIFPSNFQSFLLIGLLTGGMAFLNTWEVPVWLALAAIILAIKNFSGLNPKVLIRGFVILFAVITGALILLGWWALMRGATDPLILGGEFKYFKAFMVLGVAVGLILLLANQSVRLVGRHFLSIGLFLAGIVIAARILWSPFFSGFVPQQSEVIWVIPHIRTTFGDFFSIYGFFLPALLSSFVVVYANRIFGWIGKNFKNKRKGGDIFDNAITGMERLISPTEPILGMLALGIVTLTLFWGASWVHWTENPQNMGISQFFAMLCGGGLTTAMFLRKRWEAWLVPMGLAFLWIGCLLLRIIHFSQEVPLTLNLGLFSVLWLLAFFHLGLAVKTRAAKNLSFCYTLVSLFFFVLSAIEVFAVKEYLGGDLMRTNSVFKYGIVAWEVASVCAGVFFPKVFDFLIELLKRKGKESLSFRLAMMGVSGILIFTLVRVLLDRFLDSSSFFVLVLDILFVGTFLVWACLEAWIPVGFGILIGVFLSPLLFFPLIQFGYGSVLALILTFIHNSGETFAAVFLFPLAITTGLVFFGNYLLEKRKNGSRALVFYSWSFLLTVLLLMILVYPLAASARKGHWFWNGGYNQKTTLNGLAFISQSNPYDAAAIRFLNEHIPDQPCLLEFVGEGYNSWGSRFSIFTGIPALMGWDGHVHEWVTGQPNLGEDVDQRFQATDQIFRTPDPLLAKKYLDAYGVRLVMVGTVERNGVPGRKGGYPAEGLAKFSSFLPLIYRNPQVEIYYNPPPTN